MIIPTCPWAAGRARFPRFTAVMPWAAWAAGIGGSLLGGALGVSSAKSGPSELSLIAPRFTKAMGGLFGLAIGAVMGASLGIAAVAFISALSGVLAGLLLHRSF